MAPAKIVLGTRNPGKLQELLDLLAKLPVELVPQSELGVPEAPESGLSFIENAISKARHAARLSGLAAIADDSGLAVDALGGAPGIRSARYAGPDADDRRNVDKLIAGMRGVPDEARGCRFVCVTAFVNSAEDPLPIVCEGIWEGRLLHAPQGSNGFGYDPVFYVPDEGCSAAQLAPACKNAMSHRSRALGLLAARLSDYFSDA